MEVVRETAELAVERIEWAASEAGKAEKLRTRYVYVCGCRIPGCTAN